MKEAAKYCSLFLTFTTNGDDAASHSGGPDASRSGGPNRRDGPTRVHVHGPESLPHQRRPAYKLLLRA